MVGVDFYPEVIVRKKRRYVWNSVIIWNKGAWHNISIIKRREMRAA